MGWCTWMKQRRRAQLSVRACRLWRGDPPSLPGCRRRDVRRLEQRHFRDDHCYSGQAGVELGWGRKAGGITRA